MNISKSSLVFMLWWIEFVVKSMKMARTDNKTDVRIVKLSDGVEFWNQDIPDPSSSLSTNVDVFTVS